MNIVLTGFMGTGKSAVGKLLAARLGWQFIDTDEMIEKEVGMKIPEIFARRGEPAFRDAETEAVRLVSLLDKMVVSCGGGVVLRSENMDELEKSGIVVCLTASPETILARTKNNTDRPLLKTKDPLAKIKELLSARSGCYARCHCAIDTSTLSPAEVATAILSHPAVSARLLIQ